MVLFQMENGSPDKFSLICLPFAHCTNRSYPFTNGLNVLNGLNRHAHLWKNMRDFLE
jgi:hypothetical protein